MRQPPIGSQWSSLEKAKREVTGLVELDMKLSAYNTAASKAHTER